MRSVARLVGVLLTVYCSPLTAHRSLLTAQSPAGSWRGALDLAGGALRFGLELEGAAGAWKGRLCNGDRCEPFSAVRVREDSVTLELADYAAAIHARLAGDSLTGDYRNVGSQGPRVIPFRAAGAHGPPSPGPRRSSAGGMPRTSATGARAPASSNSGTGRGVSRARSSRTAATSATSGAGPMPTAFRSRTSTARSCTC